MDVSRWRAEFPILGRKTYLNSCSLGALSRRSEARVRQFLDEWHEHGASAWYETWMGRLSELRGRVGGLLGASEADIALVASVSAGLAAVASALDYGARPKVVVAELDFPTLAYAWMARPDVEVVRVPSDDGVTVDPARFADAVDGRTAVLATSHVFFTTGAIQDLGTLADIAHGAGALFLVDAYHSVGQLPVDVAASGADLFLCGPLKWMLGGPGLAYLYARPERVRELTPRMAGWFGAADQFAFDIERFAFKEDARRFELGTPALHAVHSALGGQEIIEEAGPHPIRGRNRDLAERLVEGARSAGLPLRIAARPEQRSAIIMVGDEDPAGAVAHLAERGIVVDWRPGWVRISPHFYNTEDEVDRVVAELALWRDR